MVGAQFTYLGQPFNEILPNALNKLKQDTAVFDHPADTGELIQSGGRLWAPYYIQPDGQTDARKLKLASDQPATLIRHGLVDQHKIWGTLEIEPATSAPTSARVTRQLCSSRTAFNPA